MNQMMEYKGYYGDAVYLPDDHIYHGKLQNIEAYVDYSGESISELEVSFHEAVEDYLAFIEEF